MRDSGLFSFRANGGDEEMDGERDATIGRDQSEQETSSAPCRCAAGSGLAGLMWSLKGGEEEKKKKEKTH